MKRYGTIDLVVESNSRGVYDSVTRTYRTVYVEIASVTRSEYYTANQSGFAPSIVFRITNDADYKGERFCRFKSEIYRVIRSYMTADGGVELTCEKAEEGAL